MQINEEARHMLLAEINGISDADLNKKPASNQWSIKQVLEHLYLMEGAITKTIQDKLANGEVDIIEEKPIGLTINRDTKVIAPDFATPSEAFVALAELKQKLATTHRGLIELVNSAEISLLEQKAFPHPAFGMMSLKQWIPFIGWHEKRHILQIQEVKETLGLFSRSVQ